MPPEEKQKENHDLNTHIAVEPPCSEQEESISLEAAIDKHGTPRSSGEGSKVLIDGQQKDPKQQPLLVRRSASPCSQGATVEIIGSPILSTSERGSETTSKRTATTENYEKHPIVRRSISVPESVQLADAIQSMSLRSHSKRYPSGARETLQQGSFDDHDVTADGQLRYYAFDHGPPRPSSAPKQALRVSRVSSGSGSLNGFNHNRSSSLLHAPRSNLSRPTSAYTLGSDFRGRSSFPFSVNDSSGSASPLARSRDASSRRSSSRPISYIDLLNEVPYSQQIPYASVNNRSLQNIVGSAANLLDTKKTLEMYRANVKKTGNMSVQYEFAVFLINTARDAGPDDTIDAGEILGEAKHILQRLSDRTYPFAQYYLADGYSSGLLNKGKPDHDKAFPLFLAASKHGHAEAGYRAALCYEFGWGTAKSYPKAVNFYRASASKNHPGAATRLGMACVRGDMGLGRDRQREGVKWLKRAQESADGQYNAGPYELGLLHLTGFGDDVFMDEEYAAQLFTRSAELGHVEANFRLGQIYETGGCGCPCDPGLSVHFYNNAAGAGHAEAMLALCAWYLVGAPPIFDRDEGEALAWALQAAQAGLGKGEYMVGYFREMGIGCRRDPVDANTWYVRAAGNGNENARRRLEIIRGASTGCATQSGFPVSETNGSARAGKLKTRCARVVAKAARMGRKKKILGLF